MSDEHWAQGLFKKPIEQVFAGFDDPDLSYEFDVTDLVKVEGQWYLVNTSGCSCPSYEEMAQITFGPVDTLDEVEAEVKAEYAPERYSAYQRDVLLAVAEARASLVKSADEDVVGC